MSEASVPSTRPPVGFKPWLDPYRLIMGDQYKYEVVEVWDAYTLQRRMLDMRHLHPAMNIANLWWKPVRAFGEMKN